MGGSWSRRPSCWLPEDSASGGREVLEALRLRALRGCELGFSQGDVAEGLTHEAIARLADVSRRSVQRYLDKFADGGLERLRRLAWPGKSNALGTHQDCLEDYFLEHPPRSAREAQDTIAQQAGVRWTAYFAGDVTLPSRPVNHEVPVFFYGGKPGWHRRRGRR
jgi:hypothetical protein